MAHHIKKNDLELVNSVKTLFEKEYFRQNTLVDVAQHLGINENKLKIVFKAVTQTGIHDYLTKVRVQKAKDMLQNSRMPIEQISSRVGLDRSNLTKQFRKLTGKTPTDFRKEPDSIDIFDMNINNALNRTIAPNSPQGPL